MQPLIVGGLRIDVDIDATPVRVTWLGRSVDRQPGKVIDPFLDGVLAAARQRGTGVEMHFERLELFNSSTITSIVQAIQEARVRGVEVEIVYDAAVKWQKLSFEALQVFVKDDGLFELRTI